MSAISLAEMIEVSAQQIYNYENSRNSPSPDTLAKISRAVNLPENFFLMAPGTEEDSVVYYRSMSSATKGARARAERRFEWLRAITNYVTEFVTLPDYNLPDIDVPSDPLLVADQDIENIAEEVRRHWRMGEGPVANMVLLLENQGFVVWRDNLGAETLDSLSTFDEVSGRAFVGIGTDKGTPVRWRFDAAHELGHLILHRNLDRSRLAKTVYHKKVEDQAHRFGAAFLVPMASFSNDLFGLSLDSMLSLKLKWKVSIGMMIIRARHAGLMSEEVERKLWIGYNRRKWRRNEPYDDTMTAEEPRLLRRAFELLLDQGAQTPSDVLAQLALASIDVETLTGLPLGYLSEHARVSLRDDRDRQPAPVIQIASRRR